MSLHSALSRSNAAAFIATSFPTYRCSHMDPGCEAFPAFHGHILQDGNNRGMYECRRVHKSPPVSMQELTDDPLTDPLADSG